jgi:hypothetical protein
MIRMISNLQELTARHILVRSGITPFDNTLELFIGPRIEIDRLHSADMGAHPPVDARATDTYEDSQIP